MDGTDWVAAHSPVVMTKKSSKTPSLTGRELQCLQLLARGLRSEAIAHELGVKRVTIDLHIANAKRKMNASTREHAVALAVHNKLVDL